MAKLKSEFENKKLARFVIPIASGKGGVGKSTVAFHLALALQAQGHKVGLLDADLYGPSQGQLLGIPPGILKDQAQQCEPVMAHGLQTMSMAYLIEETQPAIWRGPMAARVLQQLIFQTHWRDLDVLLLDLPPGTGDLQLTLCQKVPMTAAILVTTPETLALMDVQKAYAMFQKLKRSVLGVIENMSQYHCTHCGHQAFPFGAGGAEKLKQTYALETLGQIPLQASSQAEGYQSLYQPIAQRIWQKLKIYDDQKAILMKEV